MAALPWCIVIARQSIFVPEDKSVQNNGPEVLKKAIAAA
jgi:hypothetical protein